MRALIITIGDELLIGQVLNSNAAFIARALNGIGIEIHRTLTIGDNLDEITASIEEGMTRYALTVITGGLGPTHDDVTKKALCRYFKAELVESAEARENVVRYLKLRNSPWTDAAEEQSRIPAGAMIIPNHRGTASGLVFERDGRHCVAMPGVPHEMEAMTADWLVPYFTPRAGGRVIIHRTLKTTGIAESILAQKVGEPGQFLEGATLAFLPSPSGVRLRISASGSDRTSVAGLIGRIETHIRSKAGRYIYGTDDEELEEVIGRLLTERKLRIAVAESCTGGLIADKITNVPGSSAYFQCGVVAYSNRSKSGLLGVEEGLILARGAVSEEVAEAMAAGIRRAGDADIGLSTTGIAGPAGGTVEKPEGLVWIGYADSGGASAMRYLFGRGRRFVKERASQAALELVRRKILGLGG